MDGARQLHIPGDVPQDFANAVATILLLGIGGGDLWNSIYSHPPEQSLEWIEGILSANESTGLVYPSIEWWEYQVLGH